MSVNQNIVLKAILDCGLNDLCVLSDIEYDLEEVIEDLKERNNPLTLNAILAEVFRKAVDDMDQSINDRICELEAIPNERELDDFEESELRLLKQLNPAKDIEWYCNCLDTHIYLVNHDEIYREYLPYAIEEIEEKTGFRFMTSVLSI